MALSARRKVFLAKLETTYGVDSVPTNVANAVLLTSIDVTPIELDYAERKLVRPFMGAFQQLVTGQRVKVSLEMEAAGFGTLGPAIPTAGYDALLRGCGLARVLTAGTRVDYTPISSGFESLTCYFYQDGTLHKLLGARGTVGLTFKRNEIPVYKFEYTGLYGGISDTAVPTPTLTAYQQPLACNLANTNLTQFLGVDAAGICLESFEFNLNNEIKYRNLVNCAEAVLIVDRNPTGTAEIEAVTLAARDIYTLVRNVTQSQVRLQHGPSANRVQFNSTKAQVTNPKFGETDMIVMQPLDLSFQPDVGNDEFTLTII